VTNRNSNLDASSAVQSAAVACGFRPHRCERCGAPDRLIHYVELRDERRGERCDVAWDERRGKRSFTHTVVGPFPEDHRPGLGSGWAALHERVRKAAERAAI
jgi:hypothetical protein